jgi:topoisomerase-4 subunit B
VADEIFAGNVKKEGGHGSVEWAVTWFGGADGFVNSYCNTVPTPEGGTHEAGLAAGAGALAEELCELSGKKRRSMITTDDVMGHRPASCCRCSSASRNSWARPRTSSPPPRPRALSTRRRARPFRPLADRPSKAQADKLLDWVIERAEERLRRRAEKEVGRKTATQAAPAGQAGGLFGKRPGRARNCSSSRATRPAARPSRRATATTRRSCRFAARS